MLQLLIIDCEIKPIRLESQLLTTLWMIWKARNEEKFNRRVMKWEEILMKIQRYVTDLHIAHNLRLPKGNTPVNCMIFFSLTDYPKPSVFKLIS